MDKTTRIRCALLEPLDLNHIPVLVECFSSTEGNQLFEKVRYELCESYLKNELHQTDRAKFEAGFLRGSGNAAVFELCKIAFSFSTTDDALQVKVGRLIKEVKNHFGNSARRPNG